MDGLVLTIALVLALEIVNSAIENIADFISPGQHPQIKKIKDLSVAAVLVGAVAALIVGLLLFVPKVAGLFG
ncbi:MAG: diacylglycerol kinase family protein [Mangrovibacterium sp.]